MPLEAETPTQVTVEVSVNGRTERLQVEPRMLLVELLREKLDLTGAHIGCESSYCGACTVLMDGEPVKSCTVLAVQAHESEITTVEGLFEDGELHKLQKSFSENHALQCGYCTPGLLMSGKSLLDKKPDATKKEIKKAISGNVCRCTGYQNIVQAISSVIEGST